MSSLAGFRMRQGRSANMEPFQTTVALTFDFSAVLRRGLEGGKECLTEGEERPNLN